MIKCLMNDTNCGVESYRDTPEEKEIARLTNELDVLRRQSSETYLEVQDWERWATKVLTDFKIPFDNHKVGMRLAITQWMADKLLPGWDEPF